MSTATSNVSPYVLDARKKVQESADYLRSKTKVSPKVGLILGSGLGALADSVEGAVRLPYSEIPNFATSTAPGHQGNLVIGQLQGQDVMVMQGRFHAYEGYSQAQVVHPIHVMKAMGVETLIVTCALGGLNFRYKAGELVAIVDHINLTGTNPLIGPNDPEIGERFPVMFDCYRPELVAIAHEVATREDLRLHDAVHAGIMGPTFCTKAELRFLGKIGADTVGMSTIPEVISATHAGLKVLGIGTISDMAIADSGHHATEEEILAVAKQVGPRLQRLVEGVLRKL